METELYNKIEGYIAELNHMSALLDNLGFGSDAAAVYSEVAKKLKNIIEH